MPQFLPRILAIFLLMLVSAGAWAADYVFMSGDNYIVINNSGAITTTTTFNPSTCLWSGTSGGAFTNNGKTLKYSQDPTQSGNTRTYSTTLNTTGTNVPLVISADGTIQFSARVSGSRWNSYSNWNYTDGTWYIQNNNGSIVASTTSNDNNVKAYQVTTTNATTPTFSISSPSADGSAYVGSVNGTMTISATASGNYCPKYSSFNNHYYLEDGTDYGTSAPATAYNYTYTYELVGECTNYATISRNTVTYTKDAGHDVVAQVKVTAKPEGYNVVVGEGTCSFVLRSATIAAPVITKIEGTNQYQITTTAQGASIQYTIDGTDINEWGSNGTTYTAPITITTPNTVIKAKAVREGKVSTQTAYTINSIILAPPTITISDAGSVTLTNPNGVGTIRYTIDGSEPTASSTQYNAAFPVNNMATVKAIVTGGDGYISSEVASKQYKIESGVSGGTVILNDYEDHNWAYYKGLDYTITNPDGSTISYKDKYRYSIYSPDPRNVKITYRGYDTEVNKIDLGGTTKVNISTLNNNTKPHVSNVEGEGQNTFVYYETLEKFVIGFFEQHKATNGDWDGTPANPNNTAEQYPYTVISNPFSVRPSTGSGNGKKYYGFAGWKIIDGGEYITGHNDGDVLNLDELLHFTNLGTEAAGTYTPNCTSAEVVLEATWTQATVKTGTGAQTFDGGTYETNFIVASGDITGITQSSPCTIMAAYYPDGTANTNRTISRLTVGTTGTTPATNTVKVEWIKHGNDETDQRGNMTTPAFNANGKNMILGRGITSSSGDAQGNVFNCTSDMSCVNTVKIESGYYSRCRPINEDITSTNALNAYMIFGCDYDRARADYFSTTTNAYNTKLQIGNNGLRWSQMSDPNRSGGQLYVRTLFKSGTISGEYYAHKAESKGQRFITIEGGHFLGDIRGGSEVNEAQPDARAFTLRGKGNFRVVQQIAGGSTQRNCQGNRCIILTGGNVAGWIAAGSNSGADTGGETTGETFVYIGGNAQVDSKDDQTLLNTSSGGVVYGAGCGYSSTSTSGAVTKGSNVVLADNAYVERGIYGGGAMGKMPKDIASNIFVLGGHVGTGRGTIKDNNTSGNTEVPQSGVFGGACNVGGGYSNIYMNGGIVEGGVFGGSNISGTMDNNVKVQIVGGQVGTTTTTANVHGGGFGQSTRVTGNVDVTLGTRNTSTGETTGDAVIYGDVYGGSALGQTNVTVDDGGNVTGYANNTSTNVTLNAGTINGSLYGGALGQKNGVNGATSDIAANVYGPVQVTVNGGSVKGENSAVYGCNNLNGAPQNTVSVTVNHTDAHNDNGTTNDFTDDTYAINAVYGGGNQAAYTYGIPTVTVNNCDNSIQYVYGGGNQATVPATSVTINGGNVIGNVFGGGNNANVTGTATGVTLSDGDTGNKGTRVNINGGRILNVYGGNNNGGSIAGIIKVNVAEPASATCPVNVTDLYGGGNKAASNAGKITIGKCSNISNVYGGANQADVTGPITLNIVDGNIGTVFGGNNNSGTITGAITVNVSWNGSAKENESDTNTRRSLGSVYGGGNKAPYTGNPTVNFTKGITTGSVFGGGLGKDAIVAGNPAVNIGDWATKDDVIIGRDVFGGGDLAAVEGNPSVTVRECGTIIEGDLYGGGNAAPVYSTNTTMWGGTVMGNVFGGGNGADRTKNANGAQVGYKHDDSTAGTGDGNAVLNVYGGTIGTWTTDSSTGVSTCQDGTGGVFGGSNTNGNIRGEVRLKLDQQTETGTRNPNNETCSLKLNEVYGSGNEAAYAGTGINFTLGCVDALEKIYGGAKNADMNGNIHLKITSGTFKQVFGGNNIGGKINGTIKVTVDETGCHPVIIDELYGGGNQAPYSIYGYETALDANTNKPIPLTTLPSGGTAKDSPVVNVVSCTHIGQVFGGGLGSTAVMVGNPTVNIQQIPGKYDPDDTDGTDGWTTNPGTKLGTIGDIFGGGNAAKVVGDTYVNIGTETAILRADGTTSIDKKGANISGNVYGGGNQADVTGKTHVQVGPKPATTTP